MSVRANAKSNCHRKAHQVEPDGVGRKFIHLTRGGLRRESVPGVSRGHSSEETSRKTGGAKGRRTKREQSITGPCQPGEEGSETKGSSNYGSYPEGSTGTRSWMGRRTVGWKPESSRQAERR